MALPLTSKKLAGLPLEVEGYELEPLEQDGVERLHARDDGDPPARRRARGRRRGRHLRRARPRRAAGGGAGAGRSPASWTLGSFFDHVGGLDLFPAEPVRDTSRLFRRWAFESAALDLALRQAGITLADALGRELAAGDVRRLAAARQAARRSSRSRRRLERYPSLRFKLDPTGEWTDELIAQLVDTGAVDSVDFKGFYTGTVVDQPAGPGPLPPRRGGVPRRLDRGSRPHRRDAAGARAAQGPAHVGRADPLDRRHRGAAVPAADGEREALALRQRAGADGRLRLPRRARHRRLRRRPVRARARARAHPVPRLAVPPGHAQRRGARRLQPRRPARRAARQPARAAAERDRLSLGGASHAPNRRCRHACAYTESRASSSGRPPPRITDHGRSLQMGADQAQEGRRGRQARPALHEARARDHRRRARRRRRPRRQRRARQRDREGQEPAHAQGQHRARDRQGHGRRRRRGRDRGGHLRGLRPRRRGDPGRVPDRQPQPHGGGDPPHVRPRRREPRRAGLGGVDVREEGRAAGGRRAATARTT